MSDLTCEELSEFERNAEHLPSSPITLREIEPLLAEIRHHRAMVKRLEAWAAEMNGSAARMSAWEYAKKLRNRMKGA